MIKKILDSVVVIGEGGSSNSVAVAGRDCVVIVDTSLFPEKAVKIRRFVQEIFGKPVGCVINTHYHPDHTFGNEAFEDLEIISSYDTRRVMEEIDADYVKRVWGEERLENHHIVLPSETFQDHLNLKRCGLKFTLVKMGGHTPDSSIAFFEDLGLLVSGDLMMNGYHLEITSDSDLEEWKKALDEMREMSPLTIVPGHGESGGMELIKSTKDYILKIEMFVEGKIDETRLLADPNFSKREFPELFSYSLDNLLRIIA